MRCRFAWYSAYRGDVQCWHDAGHGGRHEAWSSPEERRDHPGMASWVAVGVEDSLGAWFNARWLS